MNIDKTKPVIDTHRHFWNHPVPSAFSAWMNEELSALRKEFSPSGLQNELEQAGVDACVAVQTWSSVEETLEYLSFANTYSYIAGVVGWLDLSANSFPEDLAEIISGSNGQWLSGLRHTVDLDEEPSWFESAKILRSFSEIGNAGLTYDLLISPRYIHAATLAVTSVAECSFVLDHAGKPPLDLEGFSEWEKSIRILAKEPNVSCKMSGLVTIPMKGNYEKSPQDVVNVILENFGPNRLMFGSDWPIASILMSYGHLLEVNSAWVSTLTSSEKDLIFGGNAMDFYNLTARQSKGV